MREVIDVKEIKQAYETIVACGRLYMLTLDCGHKLRSPSISWRDITPAVGHEEVCLCCGKENLRPELPGLLSRREWGSINRLAAAAGLNGVEIAGCEAAWRYAARCTE
jgi:hypothetical protein